VEDLVGSRGGRGGEEGDSEGVGWEGDGGV